MRARGPRAADPDDAVFQQRAIELKDEANALYRENRLKRALEVYEQALNLLDERDATRAMIYSNRAACFMKLGCYADVVAEAGRSLALDASSHKAYWHRAQAYERLGQVAKAKRDLQHVLTHDPEDVDAKRALDELNGVKPSAPAGLGGLGLQREKKAGGKKGAKKSDKGGADEAAAAQQQQQQQQQQRMTQQDPPALQIKAVFGQDVRMFSVFSTIGFKDLVTSIATKFNFAGQFSIKYEDEEGVMRNVQSKSDFQKSIYATSNRLRALATPPLIPYVKLFIQELPKIEDIELVDENGKPAGLAPNEVVEIDEWILDFSSLFREHLGIDAEGHLDLNQDGMNLSSDLANSTEISDDEAKELLNGAIAKFQEAAAACMFNWGNVHMCQARKKMDGGREPPTEEGTPGAAITIADNFAEVEELMELAKTRFEKALSIKPDHHDTHIALAQRRYERSRLLCAAAGLSGEDGKVPSGHDAKKRAAEAEAEFEGAAEDYKTALGNLPEEVPKEKTEEEKAHFQTLVDEAIARGEEPPSVEEPSLKAQVRVMLGNTLFEHSQMLARLGKTWRPMLDESLVHFKDAGCVQADIDNAIKMHKGLRMETGK